MRKSFALLIAVLLLFSGFVIWQYQQSQPQEELMTPQAVGISYLDILNNPEFKQGIQQAVFNNDKQLFAQLQNKAVEIAEAAGLPEEEMEMLTGDSGERFIRFQAARQLFNIAFEKAFQRLEPIDHLKIMYPEAEDLFEKADNMIAARDEQILQIATEMAQGRDIQPFLEQARQQWLQRAQNN